MFSQVIAHLIFGSYSSNAAAKSAVGLRIPEFDTAHNRAQRGFFVCGAFAHLSMVAQVGASSEAPGSVSTGNANSVWATTNHGFASVGGSYLTIDTEAANMATIPTQTHFKETVSRFDHITRALRSLRSVVLNDPEKNASINEVRLMLQEERETLRAVIIPCLHEKLGIEAREVS